MRFKKRPVEIEAVRWTGSNFNELHEWTGGVADFQHMGRLCVRTLEGPVWATRGDWIIKGVKGEFYPCRPDIFNETYEPVGG